MLKVEVVEAVHSIKEGKSDKARMRGNDGTMPKDLGGEEVAQGGDSVTGHTPTEKG
ncbi:hypothetical protein DPMN_004294 [Dreissena polymorpha]|uniref:Uncharacterized protein n=1 Tax=Dreissena polymorpha TaxID=45954 RepID=A0A9D4RVH7_DREPO|nr:hypothetical protein DPMN_004294 [Dreissena polymorpha]